MVLDYIQTKPLQVVDPSLPTPSIANTDTSNKTIFPYDVCVRSKTLESRAFYCNREFINESESQICQNDFCNTCCDRQVQSLHPVKNQIYLIFNSIFYFNELI